MDFISLDSPDGSWIFVLQVIGLALVILSLPLVFKPVSDSKWGIVFIITLGLGVVSALVSFVGVGFQKDAELRATADWESAVIAEVQGVYGIELSHDEFVALDFPATEPDGDFVAYGTIAETVVKSGRVGQKATTLIWLDGELSLGSLKGELTMADGD